MTKRDAEDYARMTDALRGVGLGHRIDALRRISRTLHRWAEHECNGTIQRDGPDGTGIPYAYNPDTGHRGAKVPDRERGALKRLDAIMHQHPTLTAYVQGDPRGCALYIQRPMGVREGQDAGSCYTNGIAVY